MTSDDQPREPTPTDRIRAAASSRVRRVLSAYSGEHAVYGVVLVTALIAVGWEKDTDRDVLLFVLGTVVVFWLAHVYAAVVASRAFQPPPRLTVAIRHGVAHTSGLVVAMAVPALLLLLAVVGWIEEYTAYFLALGSGVIILALIGYGNAVRNRGTWSYRIAGTLATTSLGLLVIALSILVH